MMDRRSLYFLPSPHTLMPSSPRLSRTLLYSLLFLLFFQLVSDFVETIYTFGLLGTNIPPQIVSVLLFFSPLILLFFKRGLPRQATWSLLLVAALSRSVEVISNTGTKMIASGLGVGCILMFFPLWLGQHEDGQEESPILEAGFGLLGGLVLSILFRVLGAGTDLSLIYPWLSWVLAAILLVLTILAWNDPGQVDAVAPKPQASSSSILFHSIGFMAFLAVLYFGFSSPLVLARWSGVDDRLIIGLLIFALGIFAAALVWGWLDHLPRMVIWIWNALFLAAGTVAIMSNQVSFPAASDAYPISQPAIALAQQIPLFLMILLSPVILQDMLSFIRHIKARQPSPRNLATGFFLGALFLLIIVLTQVFTTVYDYIPVVGPWLRDRFWLVFLIAGLGMALPMLDAQGTIPGFQRPILPPLFRKIYFPAVIVLLLAAFGWDLASQPSPMTPTGASTLRIVTYNIQQGYSASGQRNYQGQLELIRSLQPDIVGLEESDTARFSGGNADVARTIAQGLGMYSYYGPRTVTGTFGIALLSRYPMIDPRTIFMYSLGEQTAAIAAQVLVNGKQYSILVTHLGNGGPIIQQQEVLAYLKDQSNVIAMGDFNFEPTTPQYELTTQSLQDAWVQVGSPLPDSLNPGNLIDHIFISRGISVKSVSYINSPASDHPAMVMEISP